MCFRKFLLSLIFLSSMFLTSNVAKANSLLEFAQIVELLNVASVKCSELTPENKKIILQNMRTIAKNFAYLTSEAQQQKVINIDNIIPWLNKIYDYCDAHPDALMLHAVKSLVSGNGIIYDGLGIDKNYGNSRSNSSSGTTGSPSWSFNSKQSQQQPQCLQHQNSPGCSLQNPNNKNRRGRAEDDNSITIIN